MSEDLKASHLAMSNQKEDLSPTFCVYPFIEMSTIPSGAVRPCCFYLPFPEDNGKPMNLKDQPLDKIWNSSAMKTLRRDLMEGKTVPNCAHCYKEEKHNNSSMRLRGLQDWMHRPDIQELIQESAQNDFEVKTTPKFLEIKPGNNCNLKCRMCNQFDSSLIAKEIRELSTEMKGIDPRIDWRLFEPGNGVIGPTSDDFPDWDDLEEAWESIRAAIPNLEILSIAGGEPSLLKKVHELLKYCVDTGHSKHIRVFFASNLVRVDQELLNYAEHFECFEFIASIDGTEGVQEYIRFPSNWKRISENFLRIKEKTGNSSIKVLSNITIQLYNVLSFTDILRWLETVDEVGRPFFAHPFNLNILYFPETLSLSLLPMSLRPLAIERIENYRKNSIFVQRFPELNERFDLIINMLNSPLPKHYDRLIKIAWEYTQILDKKRGQSFANSLPELESALREQIIRIGHPTEQERSQRDIFELYGENREMRWWMP